MGTRDLEQKVKTFEDIHDIVNAMKAYAGLNIRKTEEYISTVRAFEQNVFYALAGLIAGFPVMTIPERTEGRRVLIVFGSDQGLCGPYNDRITDVVSKVLKAGDALFIVGRRLKSDVEQRELRIADFTESAVSVEGIMDKMETLLVKIMAVYSGADFFNLAVVFTTIIKNRAEIIIEQILPPDINKIRNLEFPLKKPLIYLKPETLLEKLVQEILYISVYRCYIEAIRSENWYRIRSMESASENITKNITDLEVARKYLRQEEITAEILEILGGSRLI
jgi:F-type H+-transporting ATPase subunit gamma